MKYSKRKIEKQNIKMRDTEIRMERLQKDRIENNIVIQELNIVIDYKMDLKIEMENFEKNLGVKIQIKKATKIEASLQN